jgi:hypothetical protein
MEDRTADWTFTVVLPVTEPDVAEIVTEPRVSAVASPPPADPIRYDPVSRQVIESRLQKYVGNDKQREDTLRQMFSQAGCDDEHLSQQSVKGSKLSNLICVLPGSTNRVVIAVEQPLAAASHDRA